MLGSSRKATSPSARCRPSPRSRSSASHAPASARHARCAACNTSSASALVARDPATGQHGRRGVELIGTDGQLLVGGPHRMPEVEPGVPDRVPQIGETVLDLLGAAAMHDHHVDVAARRHLSADPCHPRRAGTHRIDRRTPCRTTRSAIGRSPRSTPRTTPARAARVSASSRSRSASITQALCRARRRRSTTTVENGGCRHPYNPCMHGSSPRSLAMLAVAGLMAAVGGCSSDEASPPTTLPATSAPVARVDDGILTIGVLTPQGSANADIGQAIGAAVELAVTKINDAGGYGGKDIVLINADEGVAGVGEDPAIATLSDVAASMRSSARRRRPTRSPGSVRSSTPVSSRARRLRRQACSTTSPIDNLFFRTIPSDSLQAVGDRRGRRSNRGEPGDRRLHRRRIRAVVRRLGRGRVAAEGHRADRRGAVLGRQRVDRDGRRTRSPRRTVGVVVVIGDATSGPVMLGEIDAATSRRCARSYVVNDAMRRPTASAEPMGGSLAARGHRRLACRLQHRQEFLAETRRRPPTTPVRTRPTRSTASTSSPSPRWPAARRSPTAIAAQIPAVSASGSPCMTFAGCRADIEAGSNINYDGPGGT